MPFNLVRYSQQDPAWKSVKLGDSSYTLGSSGCAVTCVAMYLSGFGYTEDPQSINKKLKSKSGFINGAIIWATVSAVHPQIKFDNLVICRDSDAPLAQINAAIAAGQPVLVEVDYSPSAGLQTHWLVVYAKKDNDYLVLDPWPYPVDSGPVTLTSRYSHGKALKRSITAVAFYRCTTAGVGTPSMPPPASGDTDLYIQVVSGLANPGLRLRKGATTESDTLGYEASGTRLRVIEPESTAQPKVGVYNQWIHVRDPFGLEGYVAAWYVELSSVETPAPQPSPSAPPEPGNLTPPTAKELIAAINSLRESHDAPALGASPILTSISQQHANYMASSGGVTHYSSDGSRPFQRALAAGYPLAGDLSLGGFLSENILAVSSNNLQSVLDGWLADAPHMNTMLSTSYKEIGAGIAVAGNLIYYCIDCAQPTTSTTNQPPPAQPGTPPAPWIPPTPSTPPAPPPPPQSELYVYVSPSVGSGGLRLRRLPDSTSAILRVLPIGEKLTMLDDERVLNNRLGVQNKYFQVRDRNGTFGYVAAWLVQKAPVETPPPPESPPTTPPTTTSAPSDPSLPPAPSTGQVIIVYVAPSVGSGGTVLRRTPGPAGVIIAILSAGDKLTVLDEERVVNNRLGVQNKYLNVRDQNGREGFVAAWLVQRNAPGTPVPAAPAPAPSPAPTDDTTPEPTSGLHVSVAPSVGDAGLRMRAQPTTMANLVAVEPVGAKLAVLDTQEVAEPKIGQQNQWLWVQDPQGRSGYVAAWLVLLTAQTRSAATGPTSGGSASTEPVTSISVRVSSLAGTGLRMRAQPNTTANVIRILPVNTPLVVLDPPDQASGKVGVFNQWLKVRDPQGDEGYVAAWYVAR